MSKYKKDEVQGEDGQINFGEQNIQELLNINISQNEKLLEEKINVQASKHKFQQLIDSLLKIKKGLFQEGLQMDESCIRLANIFSSEQQAKLLISMEKLNSTNFSIFNLWNIKQVNKEDIKQSTLTKQQKATSIRREQVDLQ